jgi:AcrR family transcriptional regulator
MGTKERHERDREAVRRSILDAARDLFVSEGFHHVSMRKIAERIEYSPAALYGYFACKDDIFFALAEEGFSLMHGHRADDSALERLSPLERVRAIFWQFYQYSVDHPQYFALMFVDRSVPRISREYERFVFAREEKARLITAVQHCIDDGVFPASTPPTLAFRVLATGLLGVVVMRLSHRLAPDEDADTLAHDILDITLAGLQAGVPLRSHVASTPCLLDDIAEPIPEATHS